MLTSKSLHEKQLQELEVLTGYSINYKLISPESLQEKLADRFRHPVPSISGENEATDFNSILKDALDLKSSDIHLEIGDKGGKIRYRIDGKMFERFFVPHDNYPSLVNKIKILSGMDITQKRVPQDGRIHDPETGVDIRVSSILSLHGEKLVLRLLKKDNELNGFQELGMNPEQIIQLKRAINLPYGLVLVSGPTGSGKTTTLYRALSDISTPERNILTIEDPIESPINGINQVQVNDKVGLSFSAALRSFLRQDPDVIMVGEIRDAETAEIAVRAALTGHLVISTIHTNSAWGIIERMLDLGIPSYLLSSTINLLAAQRLVRLICPHCKIPLSKDQYRLNLDFQTMVGQGCEDCYYSGFQGRTAIFEFLPVIVSLRKWIRENGSKPWNQKDQNLFSIKDQAFRLLKRGKTSIDEVLGLISDHA